MYKMVDGQHAQRGTARNTYDAQIVVRGPYYPILAAPMLLTRITSRPIRTVPSACFIVLNQNCILESNYGDIV